MPDVAKSREGMAEITSEHGDASRSVPDRRGEPMLTGEQAARLSDEASARRYRFLAKAIPQIVWTANPAGSLDSFNPRWSEYTGLPSRPHQNRNWHKVLHPEDVPRWVEGWAKSRSSGMNLALDLRLRRSDGLYRWHLARGSPIRDRSGRVLKWLGTCTDIDDQKRAEGMLGFLADVSTLLASSLDYETTLAAVPRMAVPHVADWCVVDMLEPDGKTRRLAVAHRDPEKIELGWNLAKRYPPSLGDPRVPLRVLRTGCTELVTEIDDAILSASAVDAEHLAMLRLQACTSSISAPLAPRGRTLGVITFAMAESGRRYSKADLPLVEDLARRAALAVDNARLYREAQQAREEAESANRAKDRFLAVLSHELRTPLTPVLAEVSAMLEDPATPDSVRAVLEMTRRNVELEARLIDDLLDMNRIIQGKLRLNLEVVDAHEVILEALQICRAGIDDSRHQVEVELGAVRTFVEADAARLQQVVWNLIKNAVKFTPDGGFLKIRTGNEGDQLIVEVADTGVGIEPETLPQIFDAFEQGGTDVTQRFGGLGLGLAISRTLAEAHGGRLVADSPGKNQGATFTLELPTVEASRQRLADKPSAADDAPANGPLRILLVEDNLDTLRVMARLLTRIGHQVSTADGVASALGAAQSGEFDLLISDLGLPDGSGLDLIRKLREGRPGGIRGIALSGFGMDDDLRRSREAGFVEHLVKPVDFNRLESAIRRVAAIA
jgi:PAS domain S-box-containing protein